jgi:hypothetical protein
MGSCAQLPLWLLARNLFWSRTQGSARQGESLLQSNFRRGLAHTERGAKCSNGPGVGEVYETLKPPLLSMIPLAIA